MTWSYGNPTATCLLRRAPASVNRSAARTSRNRKAATRTAVNTRAQAAADDVTAAVAISGAARSRRDATEAAASRSVAVLANIAVRAA